MLGMWLSYNDRYDVSSNGQVRNSKSKRLLTPGLRNGYSRVHLVDGHKDVHRMVAERFCPKIDEEGLTVDHINRDLTNNSASNLRWADKSTQMVNRMQPLPATGHSNISKTANGNYIVRIQRRNASICNKTFITLEEAITYRDNIV